MKENISSWSSADAGVSNTIRPTPMAHGLQYPDPVAHSEPPRHQSVHPPPSLAAGLSPSSTIPGTYHPKGSLDGLPVSAVSSASSRGRQGTRIESPQNDRYANVPLGATPDQRHSFPQDRYNQSSNQSFHDPEKASQAQYPAPNSTHINHAHSTYISEEEEDIREHTVWILVSQNSSQSPCHTHKTLIKIT